MSTASAPQTSSDEQFFSEWHRWRTERLFAVNSPDGPPTLAATYWLDETEPVPGAGRWSIRDGDVMLTLPDGMEAVVNTVAQSGEIIALLDGEEAGPRIHLVGLTAQVTTRSGRRGVRVFDHSRANRVSAIDAFEPSTDWLIEGRYTPLPDETTVSYDFALESGPRELDVPGTVSFTIGGQTYETSPFLDDDELLLVFSDATSGHTTKPPSRFLTFSLPRDTGRRADAVALDFNRAFLPPCAFSDHFNCPLPPARHRFEIAITAGEKWAAMSSSTEREGSRASV
jgi:uncharacterized protein